MKKKVYIETTVVSYPIVEEVRRYRHEHERQCGYDLDTILADIRRHQKCHPFRVVRYKPKRGKANNRLQRTALRAVAEP